MIDKQAPGSCNPIHLAIVAILGIGALLLGTARIDAATPGICVMGVHLPGLCLWRLTTGQACLTCGLTRAISFALHGNLAAATSIHPSALPVLAWAACQALYRAGVIILDVPCPRRDLDAVISSTSLALVILIPRLLLHPAAV